MGTNELPFQIIHAHAAGIDVGSRSHLVAVDQNKENVREFGVYTKDSKEPGRSKQSETKSTQAQATQ